VFNMISTLLIDIPADPRTDATLLLGHPTFTPLPPHNNPILIHSPTHPITCHTLPILSISTLPTYILTQPNSLPLLLHTYIHSPYYTTTTATPTIYYYMPYIHAYIHTYLHTYIHNYIHAYIQGHFVSNTSKPLCYPITCHTLPNHTRSSSAQATTATYPTYTYTYIHTYMHTYKATSYLTCYLPYLLLLGYPTFTPTTPQ
jgi:hypothetical protein